MGVGIKFADIRLSVETIKPIFTIKNKNKKIYKSPLHYQYKAGYTFLKQTREQEEIAFLIDLP